ncbi:protein kinase [Nesterenkonia sp.]|uniref:protein kinase domain-containing protein n=1 Tax=Nesterenkonia sp. TaxID=704201 RepID=UPI002615D967|nr:protein kinase [Nesterenkonia sp.]
MTETSQRVLNGRYRIEALIGRGGMADVYRAVDLSLDRIVAVKMLRPDLARDPMFQTRFRREAQSSASLNHPNIVGVYDTGQVEVPENGGDVKTPFIVMEFVDGVTLRHILHGTPADRKTGSEQMPPPPPESQATGGTRPMTSDSDVLGVADDDATQAVPHVSEPLQEKIDHALGQPLSEQEAAGYISGVLGALSYSHAKGIVHRDIKPSNVMVGNDGEVKVMDFGIARALADSAQTMTQTSAVVGTAQYLSPEQARGEVVDHRSDLYSAGCVLFELLTNRPPFTGDSPVSVAYQHVREDPPMVSDLNNRVSPAMESVVAKALTKDPALRFQSAEEFDQAVADALRGIPVDEAPTAEMAAVAGAAGAGRGSFDDVVAPGAVGTPLSARTPEDPDIDDYYQDYREPPRRRSRGLWAILLLVLILGVIAGGTFVLSRVLDSGEPVQIPEVAEMPRSDAIDELNAAGLNHEIRTEPHDEIAADHAIGTEPSAGEQVERGSEVVLVLSEGADSVTIPDGLIGESEESVRATLEDIGLEIGEITKEDDPELGEGEVISTDPEAGTDVDSGSEVNLVVSTGMMEVPEGVAVGEWRSDVEAALGAAGIPYELEWVETEDVEFDGEVIGIEAAGESVTSGDRIPNGEAIIISAGYQPEEEPEEDEEDSEDENSGNEDENSGDEDENSDSEDEESNGNGNGNGNNGNGRGNGNGSGNNDDGGEN